MGGGGRVCLTLGAGEQKRACWQGGVFGLLGEEDPTDNEKGEGLTPRGCFLSVFSNLCQALCRSLGATTVAMADLPLASLQLEGEMGKLKSERPEFGSRFRSFLSG